MNQVESRLKLASLNLIASIALLSTIFCIEALADLPQPTNLHIRGAVEACDEFTDERSRGQCALSVLAGGAPTLFWEWNDPTNSGSFEGYVVTVRATNARGEERLLWTRTLSPASRKYTLAMTGELPCGSRISYTVAATAIVNGVRTTSPPSVPLSFNNPDRTIRGSGLYCNFREAKVAVHTGEEWSVVDGGNTKIFRDNPPLTGTLDITPGRVQFVPVPTGSRYNLRSFIWERVDFRFDGSQGRTFRDERNRDGFLGITPVGEVGSPTAPAPTATAWHSNGLQLMPGVPTPILLQQRRFIGRPYEGQWQWQSVPGAKGTLTLDPGTVIVGVSVVVVTESSVERPNTKRARAELWFDGRSVDRLYQNLSSGGHLESRIDDHDPQLAISDQFGDPRSARLLGARAQQVDSVWSYCGIYHQRNIQFRLVSFNEINYSDVAVPGAPNVSGIPASQRPYWVGRVGARGRQLAGIPPTAPPTIPVVVVRRYASTGFPVGPAQAWQQGLILGENSFDQGGSGVENTLAHEIGHVLGYGSDIFDSHCSAGTSRNLMCDVSRALTRAQCEVAYRRAQSYAIR